MPKSFFGTGDRSESTSVLTLKFCFGSVRGGGEGRERGISERIPKSLFSTGGEGWGGGRPVLMPKSLFFTGGEGGDGGDPVLMSKFCISHVGEGGDGGDPVLMSKFCISSVGDGDEDEGTIGTRASLGVYQRSALALGIGRASGLCRNLGKSL
jgi:hypothetical protein